MKWIWNHIGVIQTWKILYESCPNILYFQILGAISIVMIWTIVIEHWLSGGSFRSILYSWFETFMYSSYINQIREYELCVNSITDVFTTHRYNGSLQPVYKVSENLTWFQIWPLLSRVDLSDYKLTDLLVYADASLQLSSWNLFKWGVNTHWWLLTSQ